MTKKKLVNNFFHCNFLELIFGVYTLNNIQRLYAKKKMSRKCLYMQTLDPIINYFFYLESVY